MNDCLFFFSFLFSISNLVRPVVNLKGEAPVAGYLNATLVSCFASNALPAAAVTWRFGDLENSLRTETNHTVHPNGTITVVSYLLGVPFKHLNKKNVQCVVKHNTLREDLVLNYTINIHCKYVVYQPTACIQIIVIYFHIRLKLHVLNAVLYVKQNKYFLLKIN